MHRWVPRLITDKTSLQGYNRFTSLLVTHSFHAITSSPILFVLVIQWLPFGCDWMVVVAVAVAPPVVVAAVVATDVSVAVVAAAAGAFAAAAAAAACCCFFSCLSASCSAAASYFLNACCRQNSEPQAQNTSIRVTRPGSTGFYSVLIRMNG